MEWFAFNLFNGTIYGMLLFLLSSGLTLVFSLMGILNFAHASFYMLGAYCAYALSPAVGFFAAVPLAAAICGTLGVIVERGGLRRIAPLGVVSQILFTFGLEFVIEECVTFFWGKSPVPYTIPTVLDHPLLTVNGVEFSAYRVAVLFTSIVVLAGIYFSFSRSRIGLLVRASLTRPEMVMRLGHNVPLLYTGLFALGCALAGLSGALAGNMLGTEPGMAKQVGTLLMIVVVVGGLGSLFGAWLASLLIGITQTFLVAADVSVSDLLQSVSGPVQIALFSEPLSRLAPLLPYLLMLVVLVARPKGLFGTREI